MKKPVKNSVKRTVKKTVNKPAKKSPKRKPSPKIWNVGFSLPVDSAILKPEGDGWIKWKATKDSVSPVHPDTLVDVRFKGDNTIYGGLKASNWGWSDSDLSHYRVKGLATPEPSETVHSAASTTRVLAAPVFYVSGEKVSEKVYGAFTQERSKGRTEAFRDMGYLAIVLTGILALVVLWVLAHVT